MIQAQAGISLYIGLDLSLEAEHVEVAVHVTEQALTLSMADIGITHHLLDDQIAGNILGCQVTVDQINLYRGDAAQVQVAVNLVDGHLITEQLEAGITQYAADGQNRTMRDI